MAGGKISLCCSRDCYKQWVADGSVFPEQPCILCGAADHKILQCPHLTTVKIADMKAKFGYEHTFQYWHNVNNVARVNNYLRTEPLPQDMQQAGLDPEYTHGTAVIGLQQICDERQQWNLRPLYFDLGGYFNLMDDTDYAHIADLIQGGHIPKAQLLTQWTWVTRVVEYPLMWQQRQVKADHPSLGYNAGPP